MIHLGPFGAELKVIDQSDEFPGGAIEGYASVFNNVDLGGDIVLKGAFKKTLKENIPGGRVKFVDSHKVYEGTRAVIGVVPTAKEDDYGLRFQAKLSSVQEAQDVRIKVKEGILDAISFGYNTIKSDDNPDGTRNLRELKLFEISVVPWGMNPKAVITGAKGLLQVSDFKLAPADHEWNPVEAQKRILEKIGGDPDSWSVSEWKEYSRGFLWCDESHLGSLDSYHLPVADVVKGEFIYVWGAVHSALANVRAGMGNGSLSLAKKAFNAGVESQIQKLYQRFEKEFPEKGIPLADGSVSMPEELKVLIAGMDDITAQIKLRNLLSAMRGV